MHDIHTRVNKNWREKKKKYEVRTEAEVLEFSKAV